jgi:uncharacterized RDD family membrane protein YckC
VGAIVYASNVRYAGFWLRFVAYLVDRFILGIVTSALFVPVFFVMGGVALVGSLSHTGEQENIPPGLIAALVMLGLALAVVALVTGWLYFAYLESGENQATWGKQILGLYVTDLAGNRISFARATGRSFAKIITGSLLLGIGYIMAGFTERRQALHDMIASCLVLRR